MEEEEKEEQLETEEGERDGSSGDCDGVTERLTGAWSDLDRDQ